MGLAFICSSLHKVEFSVVENACIHVMFPEAPLVWSFRIVSPWLSVCCPLVHLVDIWNVIEALRENALNNLDPSIELNVARLEAVISTIFYQLNKRMPTTHQINVEQSISLLLNFLLAAFDP